MKPIAFVVNGERGGPMDTRAQSLARSFDEPIRFVHRSGSKLRSIASIFKELVRIEPRITVVFDVAFSGLIAAFAERAIAGRLIVDTGDAVYALAKAIDRSRVGLALTYALEESAFRIADAVVVRGTYHQQYLAERGIASTVIQDGVDVDDFSPTDSRDLRKKIGASDQLTFGLVGSSAWVEKSGVAYGWDLVEALAHLRDAPVHGVMIGSGDGIPHLKARAKELGVEDRISFLGHVPYAELAAHLSAIDVCLSTQTNDLVGQVRTTGKIPLYMASGRYILATDVGEAHLVLPEEMRVPYEGRVDRAHPVRLAERIRELADDRSRLKKGLANIAVAREKFDYRVLGARYAELIAQIAAK